ncbi:MAG TPA: PAS domain S-box protein, partial [Acidimicrobiales bacterium]|nr:PAS domain S-box protein [Acidimicrobiales bacterium]
MRDDRSAVEESPSVAPARTTAPVAAVEVVEQLGDAVVVADREGTILFVNPAAGRLFGRSVDGMIGRPVVDLVPPRLRGAHRAGFDRFVSTGERRLRPGTPTRVAALRADGAEVPIELLLGGVGRPTEAGFAVVATLRDVSERVALESRAVLSNLLQAAVEASRDGVLAVSPDRRVLAVNRRFCEMWRLPPDSVKVGDPSPALAPDSLSQVVDSAAFESAIRWGHAHPTETQVLAVALLDGRVLEGYAAPIVDAEGHYQGRVWYLHDDSERRVAEGRLVAAERAHRFLLDAAAVVSGSSGYAETLQALAAVAVPALGDLCLIDVLDDSGGIRRAACVHADPALQPLADRLRRFPPDAAGDHPSAVAIREGASRFSPHMTREFLRATSRDDAHLALLDQLQFTSYVTVPLVADGASLGALTIISAGSGRRFGGEDLALVEELARRVATVVGKERRFENQRSLAHSLQSSLLPADPPAVPGVEVAVRYLPATSGVEVGGDFWDVSVLPHGDIALAVGDVAGHDMTAAATMAQLRSAARALRAPRPGDPAQLVTLLQAAWDQLDLERMATAV